MKSKSRRIIPILLALTLALGLFAVTPNTAYAATPATINLAALGGSNASNPAGVAAWNYDASIKTLYLTGSGDVYTLSGTNASIQIFVSASNIRVYLDNAQITALTGNWAFRVADPGCTLSVNGNNNTIASPSHIALWAPYDSLKINGSGRLALQGGNGTAAIAGHSSMALTIEESVSVYATGGANNSAIDNFAALKIGGIAYVEAKGGSGSNAITTTPVIQIGDNAILSMINRKPSGETHTFTKYDATMTHQWKLTDNASTVNPLTNDSISVTIPGLVEMYDVRGTVSRTAKPVIKITAQPAANTTVTHGAISGTLSLAANVTLGSTLSYQWYSNTGDSNIGGTSLGSSGGANTNTLTIPTTLTPGAMYYYCVVTATGGAEPVTSNVAKVTVVAVGSPSITTQPVDREVADMGNTSFNVAASGNPTLTYQWQSSFDGGGIWNNISNGGVYSGATTATLALTAVPLAYNGNLYRCVVSNSLGSATSNAAKLTVGTPPYYNGSMDNKSVDTGKNCSIEATWGLYGSYAPTSYQWQFSSNGGGTWSNISNGGVYSGATTATLTLTNVPASYNGYQYRNVASNSSGSTTSPVSTLTVNSPIAPTFILQPASHSIKAGSNTSFTVEVTGYPTNFDYQWQVSFDGGANWGNVYGSVYSGATTPTLTLTNVPVSYDGYIYRCYAATASSSFGYQENYSNTAKLIVTTTSIAPAITSANNTTAVNGTGGTFQVTATGTSPITYSLSGTVPAGVSINSGTGLITIAATTAVGTYSFTVTASNGTAPNASQSFTLTVKGSSTTYTITVNNGTANKAAAAAGETVNITANAAPAGQMFDKWTAAGVTLSSPGSASTSFTMPANAVTVTATYKALPPNTYAVTVNNGTANKAAAAAGETVNITANAAPAGQVFDKWTAAGVTLSSPGSANTSFTMPANAVTVTATYKASGGKTYSPVLNPVVGDTVSGGGAVPGGNVSVTLPDGTTVSTKADAGGNWSVTIPGASGASYFTINIYDLSGKPVGQPTVANPRIAVTGVQTLSKIYVAKGKKATLPVAVRPYSATDKGVKWESANPNIATVNADTGQVKGVKAGKTTLTVTTSDGRMTASCTVYVVSKATKPTSLKIKQKAVTLAKGQTLQVKPAIGPKKATGVVPVYSSGNPGVAVIDSVGMITALEKGQTTITVKAGKLKKTFKLTVQ